MSVRNAIYIWFILNKSISLASLVNSRCQNSDKKMFNELICSDFDHFSEITFTNNESQFNFIESITIKPNQKLILDDSFEWSGFDFSPGLSDITFFNLQGIQLKNSFELIFKKFQQKLKSVVFLRSNLDFYENKRLLENCDQNQDLKIDLFTNVFDRIEFYVRYPKQTCIIFFNNVQTQAIGFYLLKTSLLSHNLLNFIESNGSNIKINIREAVFDSYQIDVDKKILNYKIFENIEQIQFNSNLKQIDTLVLVPFIKLKRIIFDTTNPHEIFYRNSLWLNYLNLQVDKTKNFDDLNLDDVKYILKEKILISFLTSFELFDQDLCLFEQSLASRLIFFETSINCASCTNLWVSMNSIKLHYFFQSNG